MKIPIRTGASVAPSKTPLGYLDVSASPGAFGAHIANAMGQLGETISVFADKIEENKAAESRVRANGLLTQFQIDEEQRLATLDRDSDPNARIDETYRSGFMTRADALLAAAPDQRTREYMQNQLLTIYGNNQIAAQGAERTRNAEAIGRELQTQFETSYNIILGDPTQLDVQVERLSTALADSAGVLPNAEIDTRVREYLQGMTEASLRARLRDNPQLVLYELLNGTPQGHADAALMYAESGGNPTIVNEFGYAGLFQFGAPQLQTLGLYTPGASENMGGWSTSSVDAAGKWTGTFNIPGYPEVRTLEQFLANPAAQQAAFTVHTNWMDSVIDGNGWDRYIGTEVRGVMMTRQGLRNMIHLGGPGGARGFLTGTGNAADANGTTMADYARMGSGVVAQNGGVQAILTPQQTLTLQNAAEAEIAAQQRARDTLRTAQNTALNGLIDDAQTEVARGALPMDQIEEARGLAVQVGGAEGAAALSELNFLERMANVGTEFTRADSLRREEVLTAMDARRRNGQLTPSEIRVHDFFMDLDETIRTEGNENGYGVAVQYGVIQEPVPLNFADPNIVEALSIREAQGVQIKLHFGPQASVISDAEMTQLRSVLDGADTNLAYAVMAQFADSPLLTNEVIRSLTDENTFESRALAVAFDLAATERADEAITVLRGRAAMAAGVPLPAEADWQQRFGTYVGDAFAGMRPEAMAAFRDAAIQHYVGSHVTELQAGANFDPTAFQESIKAVMPGQVVNFNGQEVITIDPEMDREGFLWMITALEWNPNWWQFASWANPVTGETTPLTGPPDYPNGDMIEVRDITDRGTLSSYGQGLYQARTNGNVVMNDGRVLVFDLRGGREAMENHDAVSRIPVTADDGMVNRGLEGPNFSAEPAVIPQPAAPVVQAATALGLSPEQAEAAANEGTDPNERGLGGTPEEEDYTTQLITQANEALDAPPARNPATFTIMNDWTMEDIQQFQTQYQLTNDQLISLFANRYAQSTYVVRAFLQSLGIGLGDQGIMPGWTGAR